MRISSSWWLSSLLLHDKNKFQLLQPQQQQRHRISSLSSLISFLHTPMTNQNDKMIGNTNTRRQRQSSRLLLQQQQQQQEQRLYTTTTTTDTTSSSTIPTFPSKSALSVAAAPAAVVTTTSPSSLLRLDAWINHTDVSFHFIPPVEAEQIQIHLLQWYYTNRRKLPWRGDPPPWNGSTASFLDTNNNSINHNHNHNHINNTKRKASTPPTKKIKLEPSTTTTTASVNTDDSYLYRTYPITTYGIWVSEIMLQQTRVEAVIVKWCQFMTTFPNVTALAEADITDVNAIWAGLGYYRRLRLLHTAAQMVVTQYNGMIPETIDELLRLPGIGKYTAHAIASIAYQQNVPVVDGNVCRVLSRLRGIGQTIKSSSFKDQYGWTMAQQIVSIPKSSNRYNSNRSSGDINQALMELGATYCSPSGTGIHPNDPLKEFYWSTKIGIELANAINNGDLSNDNKFHDVHMSLSDANNTDSSTTHCQLCARNGIRDIIQQFRQQFISLKLPVTDPSSTHYNDTVRQLGHSLFPSPPPKVHKKEELLIIAAICRLNNTIDPDGISCEDKQWLLLKRPEDGGLLSGQWEFPSIIVWQSEDDGRSNNKGSRRSTPRIDMSDQVPMLTVAQRREHIYSLLDDLSGTNGRKVSLQTMNDGPVHHIFSHVRHTMYIEYTCIGANETFVSDADATIMKQKQWMTRSDMDQVGITSGVKKILDIVETKLTTNTSGLTAKHRRHKQSESIERDRKKAEGL